MKFKNIALTFFIISVVINTSFSQNWNINTLREINLNRNPNLDNGFRKITNSISVADFATPILVYTLSSIKNDSLGKKKALCIATSSLLASGITTILKKTIKEPRPFVTYPDIQKLTKAGSESFPSGHTTDAFALATSLSICYPKWYTVVPAYGFATAIGYSRMHLGVHYPTDVIAGALIGSGSAILVYNANRWINQKRRK